jgi:hypothetical protein
MNEQMLPDLEPLGTEDVPDVAARAIRRFRFHVVVFTVLCVIGAAVMTGMVVGWATKDSLQTEATGWNAAQTAVLNDLVGVCTTPTFTFGQLRVGVLDAVKMEGGGTAFHLVVNGPIAEQRVDPSGSAVRTTSFGVVGGSNVAPVNVQPGATWGEAYVEVPVADAARAALTISGPALPRSESFTIDTSALTRGC